MPHQMDDRGHAGEGATLTSVHCFMDGWVCVLAKTLKMHTSFTKVYGPRNILRFF